MPLNDVLSTLRLVILDKEGVLPESDSERAEYFLSLSPGLSAEEIEDLVKIPPERFSIYTGTIFKGEANVLQTHFEIGCAVISKHWQDLMGQKPDFYQLVTKAHKKHPWKDNLTLSLLETFKLYVSDELTEITDAAPFLIDIMTLEKVTIEVRRLKDGKYTAKDGMKFSELSSVTVDELLNLDFYTSHALRALQFDYDVISYRKKFYGNESILPEADPEKRIVKCIASRNRDNNVRWYELTNGVFNYLQNQAKEEVEAVSALAEAYLPDAKETDEESQLKEFLEVFSSLISIGAIILVRTKKSY